MVRIMPPEIEEQEPGKTENPKNKPHHLVPFSYYITVIFLKRKVII
jgi:hypothetical protein